MDTGKREKGRILTRDKFLSCLLHTILSHIPAFLPFLTSCDKGTIEIQQCSTEINVTKAATASASSLDVFFYNDDSQHRLDSYQRFSPALSAVSASSGSGKKIIHAVANNPGKIYSWEDICSIFAIGKLKVSLDEDSPSKPVMSGSASIVAGKERSCSLTLKPLMSEIVVESICCDFSSRSYSGQKLEGVRIYLTNVCTAAALFSIGPPPSPDYMNIGRLDSLSLSSLKHPEYIYVNTGRTIGEQEVRPNVHLYCYPNPAEEESAGTPFTRLVIEGKLGGRTVYYPFEIKRPGYSESILRNTLYTVRIKITHRGSSDPDTSIGSGTAIMDVEAKPWNEKESQYVSF